MQWLFGFNLTPKPESGKGLKVEPEEALEEEPREALQAKSRDSSGEGSGKTEEGQGAELWRWLERVGAVGS